MGFVLTIITVAFENPAEVEQTLSSVEGIDNSIEHIIVDGSSNEKIKSICQKFGVKYLPGPDDGPFDAMNIGVKHSSGRYIWILNSGDSCYDPTSLRMFLSKVRSSNDDIVFFGDTLMQNSVLKQSKFSKYMYSCIIAPHPSYFCPGHIAKKISYDTRYRYCADFLFKLKLRETSARFQYLPVIICKFDYGGISTQRSYKHSFRKRIERIIIDKTTLSIPKFLLNALVHTFAILMRR